MNWQKKSPKIILEDLHIEIFKGYLLSCHLPFSHFMVLPSFIIMVAFLLTGATRWLILLVLAVVSATLTESVITVSVLVSLLLQEKSKSAAPTGKNNFSLVYF